MPVMKELSYLRSDSDEENSCTFAVIGLTDLVKHTESDDEIGYKTLLGISWVLSEKLGKTNNDPLKMTTAPGLDLER